MKLMIEIVENCNIDINDESDSLEEFCEKLSDKNILQTKIIEFIDVNDENYSIDMDDEYTNICNTTGTNFRCEKKVPDNSVNIFKNKTDQEKQDRERNGKNAFPENKFAKSIACIEVPLIQKFYPFTPLVISIGDYELFDTVVEYKVKASPSKIISDLFSKTLTFQNIFTRDFIFQRAMQNLWQVVFDEDFEKSKKMKLGKSPSKSFQKNQNKLRIENDCDIENLLSQFEMIEDNDDQETFDELFDHKQLLDYNFIISNFSFENIINAFVKSSDKMLYKDSDNCIRNLKLLDKHHIKTYFETVSKIETDRKIKNYPNHNYDRRIENISAKKYLVNEIHALSKTKKSYTDGQFKMLLCVIYLINGNNAEQNNRFRDIFGSIHQTIAFIKNNINVKDDKVPELNTESVSGDTYANIPPWLQSWLYFHCKYIDCCDLEGIFSNRFKKSEKGGSSQQKHKKNGGDDDKKDFFSKNSFKNSNGKGLLNNIIGYDNLKLKTILDEEGCANLTIFLSVMFRIYVSQLLYDIYIDIDPEIAYQLYLFSNTHNRLLIYMKNYEIYGDDLLNMIGEQQNHDLIDKLQRKLDKCQQLETFDRNSVSPFDLYKPTEYSTQHEGNFPDHSQDHNYLNFYGSSESFNAEVWPYMNLKRYPKVCQTRAIKSMHDESCQNSDSYYKWACLCIEISLRGLYRTAKIRPSYYRQLLIDELFILYRNNQEKQKEFRKFMLENKILVNYCMMENITYLLKYNPSLVNVLNRKYSMDSFFIISHIYMDMFRGLENSTQYNSVIQYLEVAIKKMNLFIRDQFQQIGSFPGHVEEHFHEKNIESSLNKKKSNSAANNNNQKNTLKRKHSSIENSETTELDDNSKVQGCQHKKKKSKSSHQNNRTKKSIKIFDSNQKSMQQSCLDINDIDEFDEMVVSDDNKSFEDDDDRGDSMDEEEDDDMIDDIEQYNSDDQNSDSESNSEEEQSIEDSDDTKNSQNNDYKDLKKSNCLSENTKINNQYDNDSNNNFSGKIKVFRETKENFVEYINTCFKDHDILRMMQNNWFTEKHVLTRLKRMIVKKHIDSLVPGKHMNQNVADFLFSCKTLKNMGVSLNGLTILNHLYVMYNSKKKKLYLKLMIELFQNQSDYMTIFYYYETLKTHNLITIIEINNYDIVKQQLEQLCELYGVDHPKDLPEFAGRFAIAPCCKMVKANISNGKDKKTMGNIRIGYNDITDQYNCQVIRKNKRNNAPIKKLAMEDDNKSDQEALRKKFSRHKIHRQILKFCDKYKITIEDITKNNKMEEEYLKELKDIDSDKLKEIRNSETIENLCEETDIIFIPLIGRIVELKGYKEKDRKRNSDRMPFWINPCCGQMDHYQMRNWGANGYQCSVCRQEETKKYFNVICNSCHKAIKTKTASGESVLVFDDLVTYQYKNIIMCKQCHSKNDVKSKKKLMMSMITNQF